MIDLASLRDDKPRFKMLTEKFGELWCYSIEFLGIERRIESDIETYRKMDPVQVIRELFGQLVTDSNDLPLASEQFDLLSDEEQAQFANRVVERHGLIFRGKKSVERRPEETAATYIARVLVGRAEVSLKRNRSISSWAGSSTMDAMMRAQSLSDQLYRPQLATPPPLTTFRNPLDATNAHLAALEKRFETSMAQTSELYELVRSVNSAATGLLRRFAEGAIASERASRQTIVIAIVAVIVAVATPIVQNWYDRNWKPADPAIQLALEKLATDLSMGQRTASEDLRRELAAAITAMGVVQQQDHSNEAKLSHQGLETLERVLQELVAQRAQSSERNAP